MDEEETAVFGCSPKAFKDNYEGTYMINLEQNSRHNNSHQRLSQDQIESLTCGDKKGKRASSYRDDGSNLNRSEKYSPASLNVPEEVAAKHITAASAVVLFLTQIASHVTGIDSNLTDIFAIILLAAICIFSLFAGCVLFTSLPLTSHFVQLPFTVSYVALTFLSVFYYPPGVASALSCVVLSAFIRVATRLEQSLLCFISTGASWALASYSRGDEYSYDEIFSPGRLLVAMHVTHVLNTVLNSTYADQTPVCFVASKRNVGVATDKVELFTQCESIDTKVMRHVVVRRGTSPAISTTPRCMSRRSRRSSRDSVTTHEPNQNTSIEALDDAADAPQGRHSHISLDPRPRINSTGTVGSNTESDCSTLYSYVSFAASIAKLPGHRAGYLTHKKQSEDVADPLNLVDAETLHNEQVQREKEQKRAEQAKTEQMKLEQVKAARESKSEIIPIQAAQEEAPFEGELAKSGSGDIPDMTIVNVPSASILERCNDEDVGNDSLNSEGFVVAISNNAELRNKKRSMTQIKNRRPAGPSPKRTTICGPSEKILTQNSNKMHLAQMLSKATSSLREARKEVQDLMQVNFNVPTGQVKTEPSTFEKVPLGTLHKILMLISRLSEETDVIECNYLIVAGVCEILKCDRASVFLVDGSNVRTYDEEGIEISVPLDKSLVGYAALTCRVLNIGDAYCDPRFNKEVDRETGYRTRNLLVYPIARSTPRKGRQHMGTGVFAVIEAINKHNGAFTSEDECILALLGKQAGVLLSNSHFYQQLLNESNKTATLLEVSQEISDVQLDLGRMMEKIMARARQVLTVERASIFLIDESKKELWSILTDSEMAAKVGGDNVIRLPVGVGIAGTVARTGEMLNIHDAYSSPYFNPAFDRTTGYVTKAALCVPIKVASKKGRVLGVMQFINKINEKPFNEEDEKLATTFSSFVGISLNNLFLYDELREGQLVREKNKELVRLRDDAKQAAEAKANFLMSMSHEIRTPMSGVIGMTELLENTKLTDEQDEMVSTIRNCGESLLAIINDILDYGRLESGKMELEMADFDLVALAEDTMDVIRSKVEAKQISMHLSVSPGLATHVVGDQFRLRQVLINLLGNAVKFTPERGEISMQVKPYMPPPEDRPPLEEAEYMVYFEVTDSGIGIPADKHASLFLPFHQASAGTTRQYGGSGLGLSICKQLVDVMGGTIGVHSVPQQGSSFWITSCFQKNTSEDKNMTVGDLLKTKYKVPPALKIAMMSTNECQMRVLEAFFKIFGATCWLTTSIDALIELITNGTDVHEVVVVDLGSVGVAEEALPFVNKVKDKMKPASRMCVLMPMSGKSAVVSVLPSTTYVFAKPPKSHQLSDMLTSLSGMPVATPKKKELLVDRVPEVTHLRLLVAEDNKTNQTLIKRQLKQFGIEPTVCDNGNMVIEALRESHYDLILMGMNE